MKGDPHRRMIGPRLPLHVVAARMRAKCRAKARRLAAPLSPRGAPYCPGVIAYTLLGGTVSERHGHAIGHGIGYGVGVR